jgi:hypothetical protein
MEWKVVEKKVVKRGPSSTGLNFSKDELPISMVGRWVTIQVPEDFGSFQSSEDTLTKKELEKENAAYIKARRQIYQNIFYYIIGGMKRRVDLVTTDNVLLFIRIRDSLEYYFSKIQYDIIEKKQEIEKKIKTYDIIHSKLNGYKEIVVFIDTFKTTMYIKEAEYDSYTEDFLELEKYNIMLTDINKTVLSFIKKDFPNVDQLIVDTAINDFYGKDEYTTKKLLTEHSKMILHSITKGRK